MSLICKIKHLLIIAALPLVVYSCHDYRLDNSTTRISRDWYLVKYELNNDDSTFYFTSMISGYTLSFTEDGAYTESYSYYGTPVTTSGFYFFQNNLNELVLSDEDTTRVYDIITLTTHNLNIELLNTPDDNDVYYLEPF